MRYNDLVDGIYNHEEKEQESAEDIITRISEGLNRLGGESDADTL